MGCRRTRSGGCKRRPGHQLYRLSAARRCIQDHIRTDVTPSYRVERPDEQTIEVVFNAAEVAVKRLLLPIDTRFFETPVLDITPIRIEGASQNTIRVTIRLRSATEYFTAIKDSTLFLTFKR